MYYAYCGKSGLRLPKISLGLWHNFGFADHYEVARDMIFHAFEQGILTDKYLNAIPEDSRAANPSGFLKKEEVTPDLVDKVKLLNAMAAERGQTMAEMALAWILRNDKVTSVIIGAHNVTQLDDNLKSLENISFRRDELESIDVILEGATL